MKKLSCRSAYYLSAVVGTVLLGAVMFGVPASAGTSAPAASASISHAVLKKGGKLSSRLEQLSQPSILKASAKTQAAAVGLPSSGPGSLLRAAGGKQLIVYVRVSGSVASASAAIENAGAAIVNASERYGIVTAAVSPSGLSALAKLPVVVGAWEALTPMHSAACPSGDIVSEGDSQLNAASARSTYAVDGSGVPVGVLSDSYDAYGDASTGVTNGELPGTGNPCARTTPVNVLEDDLDYGEDEGRAMLEVVHDLAPGSNLSFATADNGIYGMADNIQALRTAGAKVIADDITYFEEPMFQKGPIDLAIDNVTSSGASYFSSAGNENLVVGGRNVGSYEAPAYRPMSCPTSVNDFADSYDYSYLDCHDFDTTAGTDNGAGYTLANNGYLMIDLQWAQSWNDPVGTDLDLFVIDASTGVVADSTYINTSTGTPFEYEVYQNTTGSSENVEIVVARYSGATPRLKYVITGSYHVASVQYNSSVSSDVVGPTIFGHNGGQNAITVAAVPYNNSAIPETYSSHGPVTYYYGSADGTNPAAPLGSPLVLSKPDLAATDCAQTSFFYDPGPPFRFCGTSESAPHAAAVAALMLQRNPALTPAQVLARLKATARAVGTSTSDVVGSGLIDASAAVGVSTPTIAFSSASYSIGEAGPSATITINRTGSTTGAVSAHFATANGTATAGSDYTAVSQDVNFGVGVTSQTVSIPITEDLLYEGNETVSLSLSSPTGGAELGWPSTATLTIVDNDLATLAFSAASYSVSEAGPAASITINRAGAAASAFTVHFATANGTATAGSDYTAVSQAVSFAASETSKTVSVPIINDSAVESSETVLLSLSSPSAGATLGSPSSATLTIIDNDVAAPPTTGTTPTPSSSGTIAFCKLSKKSFPSSQAGKVKLICKFSPKSKLFRSVLSLKKGKKWTPVKSVIRVGSFTTSTLTVKKLFAGKPVKRGAYRLMLSAEANSRTLFFTVK